MGWKDDREKEEQQHWREQVERRDTWRNEKEWLGNWRDAKALTVQYSTPPQQCRQYSPTEYTVKTQRSGLHEDLYTLLMNSDSVWYYSICSHCSIGIIFSTSSDFMLMASIITNTKLLSNSEFMCKYKYECIFKYMYKHKHVHIVDHVH